eukprot:EG_transcript_4199
MYSPERMPRHPGPREPGPSLHVKRAGALSPGRPQLKPLAGGVAGQPTPALAQSVAEAKLRRPTSRGRLLPAIDPLRASHPVLAAPTVEHPLARSVPDAHSLLLSNTSPPRPPFSDPPTALLASRRAGLERLVSEYTPIGLATVPSLFAPQPVPPAWPKPVAPQPRLPVGVLLDLQAIEAGKRQEVGRDEQLMWRLLLRQHVQIFAALRCIILECEEQAMRRAIEGLNSETFADLLRKFESQSSVAKQAMMLRHIHLRRARQALEDTEERARVQLSRALAEDLRRVHLTSVDVQAALHRAALAHAEAEGFRRVALQRQAAELSAAFRRWSAQWLEARHAEAQQAVVAEEAVGRAAVVASSDASPLWLGFLPTHETAVRRGLEVEWWQFFDGYFAGVELQRAQALIQALAYAVQAAYDALVAEEEAELYGLYQQFQVGGALHALCAAEAGARQAVEAESQAALELVLDDAATALVAALGPRLRQTEAAHRQQLAEDWGRGALALVEQLETAVRRELESAANQSYCDMTAAADEVPRRRTFSDLSASFVMVQTMQLQVLEYDARSALDAAEMDARVHLYVYEASERFGDYDEEEDDAVMSMVSGWPRHTQAEAPGRRRSHTPSPFRPVALAVPPGHRRRSSASGGPTPH